MSALTDQKIRSQYSAVKAGLVFWHERGVRVTFVSTNCIRE